jgi:C4-dicarboxylate transporter DctM subunit
MTVGILAFVLLITFMLINVPIAIAIGAATLLSLALATDVPLNILAQRMYAAVDSFPLMAIPYFIVAGNFMERGGISRQLVELAELLVGRLAGGLGQISVVTSAFFAAISGSGPATTAAIGSIMIPAMEKNNYDRAFATALQATAGALGPLIPPSILFVTYGVATGTSISDLFLAGVLPGILTALSLMVVVYIVSKKNGYVGTSVQVTRSLLWERTKKASWALFMPVLILGGIYGGVFTPTEAAVVSAGYGLIVGMFVYRELKLRDLPGILLKSAITSAMVMYVIATASALSWVLSNAEIPSMLAKFVMQRNLSAGVLFLLLNILLLFTGCFIELNATIAILAPLLLPIFTNLGVDPIHLGAVMVTNLCLGLVTPPFGVNLYVACGVAKMKIEEVSRWLIPLLGAALVPLLLVTYIPQLSLLLVRLVGR